MPSSSSPLLSAGLVAVLVAVTGASPRVLATGGGGALPSGPFEVGHRSLQAGLRAWVEQQTHHPLGYVEQLYTFADRDRTEHCAVTGEERRVISISYLALTREGPPQADAAWQDWYRYFPWEDRRGADTALDPEIDAALQSWVARAAGGERAARAQRVALTFGLAGMPWHEELVLQRYELLFEAGLVPEAARRGNATALQGAGAGMMHDHRRILATGIARLRAKIKYRPVVFELMPPSFTLLQLQQTVEALAGRSLHKQNFRRFIEQQELVEETGASTAENAGRPAKLFRFRREVMLERAWAGSKLPLARSV